MFQCRNTTLEFFNNFFLIRLSLEFFVGYATTFMNVYIYLRPEH